MSNMREITRTGSHDRKKMEIAQGGRLCECKSGEVRLRDGAAVSSMHLKCFIRNRLINTDPLFNLVPKSYIRRANKGGGGGGNPDVRLMERTCRGPTLQR